MDRVREDLPSETKGSIQEAFGGSSEPEAGTERQARIVIIGAGPSGLGYLERLLSNIPDLAPDWRFDIHVVDPHPPGPGRIWRYDQAPELLLNSQAYDITMFPDGSFSGEGPTPPEPARLTFLGWLDRVRAGEIEWPVPEDEPLCRERDAIDREAFPSRRLMALYLAWAFRHVVDTAPDTVRITVHPTHATAVVADAAASDRVILETGDTITGVGNVIYTVGHCERDLDDDARADADFARAHGLTFVAPQPAAADTLSAIAPGSTVIVRGAGLTAGDAICLLTEHRGGAFVRDDDGGLRYRPGGAEPRIFLATRRGVPLHTVPSIALKGGVTQPRYFTEAIVREIASTTPTLSFKAHFWPLILRDITWRTYAELFTAFPHRVACGWPEFIAAFDAAPWKSEACRGLVRRAIPNPAHRLDVNRLIHPLGKGFAGTLVDYQVAIQAHIARDLDRHRHDSTTTALRAALRDAHHVVGILKTMPNWDGRSLVQDLHHGWHPFFCSIAVGPSQEVQEKFLALLKAGTVAFLGPDARVSRDAGRGQFVGRSAIPGVEVAATALVDARIPAPSVASSTNPVLRALEPSGHGIEARYQGIDDRLYSTGRLAVSRDGQFLIDAAGGPSLRRQAVGAFVNATWVGAFGLPGSNFPFFRQTDAVARWTLKSLQLQDAGARHVGAGQM